MDSYRVIRCKGGVTVFGIFYRLVCLLANNCHSYTNNSPYNTEEHPYYRLISRSLTAWLFYSCLSAAISKGGRNRKSVSRANMMAITVKTPIEKLT